MRRWTSSSPVRIGSSPQCTTAVYILLVHILMNMVNRQIFKLKKKKMLIDNKANVIGKLNDTEYCCIRSYFVIILLLLRTER